MELLANKIRPNKLSDIYGQNHLIGKDKVLTNLVKNKVIFSMILYGPPGTGKTSIANALVNELKMPYRMLNAVINNKNDFDIVLRALSIARYAELLLGDSAISITTADRGIIHSGYPTNFADSIAA